MTHGDFVAYPISLPLYSIARKTTFTPPHTNATIHALFSMSCHFTRAKLLSTQISKNQAARATTTAKIIDSGPPQKKNKPVQPRNSTFSHHCMISTFASVLPLISVVVPFTSS